MKCSTCEGSGKSTGDYKCGGCGGRGVVDDALFEDAKNLFEALEINPASGFWFPSIEPEPTESIPGTDEKVTVLARRAERGEKLFAAGDPVNHDKQSYAVFYFRQEF